MTQHSRPSPKLFPCDLPHLTQEEMAREIIEWLNDHRELGIHNDSRIPQLCRLVIRSAGHITEPGDPSYDELDHSIKDVQEIWLMIRVLGDLVTREPFVEPFLRATVHDQQLPEDDGDNTPGRDRQFELFIAAIAYRAGFDIAHLGEGQPDWLLSTKLRQWTVEAKRVKSVRALRKHTKKAAKQIARSNVGGIIVADVSAIDGSQNRRLRVAVPDEEIERARKRMGDAIKEDLLPSLESGIGDAPVGLLILHDYLICPAARKNDGEIVPRGLHGIWLAYYLESTTSAQYPRYVEFWDLFQSALPQL